VVEAAEGAFTLEDRLEELPYDAKGKVRDDADR
jgi:hypothetical protein